MTDLRCWLCRVEPTDTAEIAIMGSAEPIAVIPTAWPPGDHTHAVTPQQLVDDGHATFRLIMEDAT